MELHGQLGTRFGRFRILQSLELGEIGAGAESGTGAREDDAVHPRLRVRLAQRLEQIARQRGVEGVPLLRPIEREDADISLVFNE